MKKCFMFFEDIIAFEIIHKKYIIFIQIISISFDWMHENNNKEKKNILGYHWIHCIKEYNKSKNKNAFHKNW